MRTTVFVGAVALCLLASPLAAQAPVGDGPAHAGTAGFTQQDVELGLQTGALSVKNARKLGLSVFSTPFNTHDGFGDGPFDPAEIPPFAFGHRPTLQGNGLSLRINGLDAQSCNECHGFVKASAQPPVLGIAGVGGIVQNAIILPTLIDVADSFDDRMAYVPGHDPDLPLAADGVADFNGRFANPPFLFGGGGVELLGKEMTADLQAALHAARQAPAGTVTPLDTHGVSFGFITTIDDAGNVELAVDGIGPEHIDGVPAEEVLVVRPFGRKGENFSMRDFDRGAMQFHFGIQPVEVIGAGLDEDGDGHTDEVTVAEMSLLHLFDVTNPRPVQEKLSREAAVGRQKFAQVGCAYCHRPELKTRTRKLPIAFPEVAHDPGANVYYQVDLVKVGFDKEKHGPGVVVPLFSDLKRHDMGPRLAETFALGEIPNSDFVTARLWGIADTAPYLHDGRATTLFEAIDLHGGEAQGARDNFLALSEADQQALLAFLRTLRTPEKPNEELVHY